MNVQALHQQLYPEHSVLQIIMHSEVDRVLWTIKKVVMMGEGNVDKVKIKVKKTIENTKTKKRKENIWPKAWFSA